jgi:hypothetical protein
MPVTYKVLGQTSPEATTLSDLYIAPNGSQVIVSSIVVANRSYASPADFRIAISPNGATLASSHYIVYDTEIGPVDSMVFSLGITVDDSDKIIVQSSTGQVSFNAFGMEIT